MDKFAFIFHPLDIDLFADGFDDIGLKNKRPQLIEQTIKWFPPFKRASITGIRSLTGKEIEGDMILCTLLPEQILCLDEAFILKRVIEAGKLAEKLGNKIVGIGAYIANIGKKGLTLAKNLNLPVTTGSSYTIFIALESVYSAADKIGIDINNANIAIIGATGTIGSICSRVLAEKAGFLTLVARNKTRLHQLSDSIREEYKKIDIQITDNISQAVSNADIILVSTNTPGTIIDANMIKSGAIICDMSRPHNISKAIALQRQDILVIDGGVVKPPGSVDFHFSFGLPQGLAYACIAETMILTLEERFESYSIGGDVTIEKVREIGGLAKKHGFELTNFRSFNRELSQERIENVKKHIKLK